MKDIQKIKDVLDENFISVVSYDKGDSTRYLWIVKELPVLTLKRLQGRVDEGHLFLTKKELETSLDVFPLEYLNITNHHRLLAGKDVLSTLRFDRSQVRRQLEFEFRSKLIHLREQYLLSPGKRGQRQLLFSIISGIAPIIDGLLFLKGRESTDLSQDLTTIKQDYGVDLSVLLQLREAKRAKWPSKSLKGKEEYIMQQLLELLTMFIKKLDALQ